MSKGFSGVPGKMQGLLKQAQKMQLELQKAQEDSAQFTGEGSSGGGMVKVVANGSNQLLSVQIDKQVVNASEIELLQDLVLAASNQALAAVQEKVKEALAKVTGNINMPGIF